MSHYKIIWGYEGCDHHEIETSFCTAGGKEEAIKEIMERHGASCRVIDVGIVPYMWVNVYKDDRAYGGHEEGGWYYDVSECLLSIPILPTIEANLDALMDELEEEYNNEGRRPVSSVCSEGEYRVSLEYEQGENWPKERPHYE